MTISVAAYNVESYIKECLTPFCKDGIRNRVEVLVIDDGVTDNTALIASEYEINYPDTFRIIQKGNGRLRYNIIIAIE